MTGIEGEQDEADRLDAYISTYGPQNHRLRDHFLPQLLQKAKDLRAAGDHAEADRHVDLYESYSVKVAEMDRVLDEAMARMLVLRNRQRRRSRGR